MEKIPAQEEVVKKTEETTNHNTVPGAQEIAEKLLQKEEKKALEAKQIEEVRKGLFARMGATLKNTYEDLTGETEKREKRASRLGVGHFKTEYETLIKTDSERAAKYKKAVENMPTFQYDEKLKDYIDVTKYAVASGEGTSGK